MTVADVNGFLACVAGVQAATAPRPAVPPLPVHDLAVRLAEASRAMSPGAPITMAKLVASSALAEAILILEREGTDANG